MLDSLSMLAEDVGRVFLVPANWVAQPNVSSFSLMVGMASSEMVFFVVGASGFARSVAVVARARIGWLLLSRGSMEPVELERRRGGLDMAFSCTVLDRT